MKDFTPRVNSLSVDELDGAKIYVNTKHNLSEFQYSI